MTGDQAPTLVFDARGWALLRDRGNLPETIVRGWSTGTGHNLADDSYAVAWGLLTRDDRLAFYRALVRACARCHERDDRLWFADLLYRLGYELIPGEDA